MGIKRAYFAINECRTRLQFDVGNFAHWNFCAVGARNQKFTNLFFIGSVFGENLTRISNF